MAYLEYFNLFALASLACLASQTFKHELLFVSSFSLSAQSTKFPYSCHKLSMAKSNKNSSEAAQFELQELKAQLSTMSKSKISPRMLASEKQSELESYLSEVLSSRRSPISLRSIGDNSAELLQGDWRLVLASSSDKSLSDLPADATVVMKFYPEYKCDYCLDFSRGGSKIWGLKSLTSQSTYMIDCSPLNPGLVTIFYQKIVTDLFGIKSLPVGLFGMLQGRCNYLETVWFDGSLWITRGYSEDGSEFFNAYQKESE